MTVFVYGHTAKQVGDAEHIKVFATVERGSGVNRPAGHKVSYKIHEKPLSAFPVKPSPPTPSANAATGAPPRPRLSVVQRRSSKAQLLEIELRV